MSIEEFKKNGADLEKVDEKVYLYHMVPPDMRGDEIHPLSTLNKLHPDLFASKLKKYEGRDHVMEHLVYSLECAWFDVVHLSPIHPKQLKQALVDAGFEPNEQKFYQIDPELLDPAKTTIYLYNDTSPGTPVKPQDFVAYDSKALHAHALLKEATLASYKEDKGRGMKHPILFVGVPHILHKDSLDVSKFRVITI